MDDERPGIVRLASIGPPVTMDIIHDGDLFGGFDSTAPLGCCDAPAACDSAGRFTFRSDLRKFLPLLRDDARGVVNWNNGLLVGAALAGSLALRHDIDEEVRREVARHPERWGGASHVLGQLGEVQYQIPILLAVYGYSVHEQDAELRQLSASLISAYTLTGLSTTVIKGIADTERPSNEWNGGHYGFPSFHAASTMSLAAVLDEHYGPHVGLPAIAVAGLVGWSRIDEQDHDLSDVVFGAVLGYVIGKSVARRHRTGDGRVQLLPWTHPIEGASGLQMDVQW